MQHSVARSGSRMRTSHALLVLLCYSVPHVDASKQIATFGDCTFDIDDAGGDRSRVYENKSTVSNNDDSEI